MQGNRFCRGIVLPNRSLRLKTASNKVFKRPLTIELISHLTSSQIRFGYSETFIVSLRAFNYGRVQIAATHIGLNSIQKSLWLKVEQSRWDAPQKAALRAEEGERSLYLREGHFRGVTLSRLEWKSWIVDRIWTSGNIRIRTDPNKA